VITIRPATRQNTPLIIGLAGPTKSGKTYSALRLATGLAAERGVHAGPVIMLNAEGPRGHQYADTFTYASGELVAPFRPEQYIVGLERAMAVNPSVLIIDSVSHMHDGPGGILEWHAEELDRLAGTDEKKRERATFTAWVKPKAAVNQFIYALLAVPVPVILCMRATEKLRLRKGQDPEFYWGPVVPERLSYETLFTLIFPPHARGVPDLAISDLRAPFDTLLREKHPVDEELGRQLAAWAKGGPSAGRVVSEPPGPASTALAGAPSGSGPGGIPLEPYRVHPEPTPARSPVQDWLDQLGNVKTVPQRAACWERLKAEWGSFLGPEQKQLLAANERAKARVGG
jgi:hypothetical protein